MIYVFVLLGIVYSVSIGGIVIVVGSLLNVIVVVEVGLLFIDWMKFGVLMVVIMLLVVIVIFYFVLKFDLNGEFELNWILVEWDKGKVVMLSIFVLMVFCWIFSKLLNVMLGGFVKFDMIVVLGVIVLVNFVCVVYWKDVEKIVDWGVLLLFGGGICLSNVLK